MIGAARDNLAARVAAAGLFIGLTVAAGLAFLHAFAPRPLPPAIVPYDRYDPAAMQAAVAPERVRARQDAIIGLGPRYPGQPGFPRAAEYVRRAMADAGLEIHELPAHSAAPWTIRREILSESGQPLPGVEIFPFAPNHFQPMVTPEDGLAGMLVKLDDEVLATRTAFDDCMGLIDARQPPARFGFNWIKYAQLGIRAVIVAHPDGLDHIDWATMTIDLSATDPETKMVASSAVNYVQLAASGDIFKYAGQKIRLKVRTEWRKTDSPVLVGVMRAGVAAGGGARTADSGPAPGEGARAAVVITADYGACSILPDASPGTLQAAQLASSLAILDGLRAYAADLKRDVIFIVHGSRTTAHDAFGELLSAMGPALEKDKALRDIQERLAEERLASARVGAILALFDSPDFLADAGATARAVASLDAGASGLFDEQVRYVLNTIVFEQGEVQLAAKLRFLRAGESNIAGEAFERYRIAKREYDEAASLSGYPLAKLLASRPDFAGENRLRERCATRFKELADCHREKTVAREKAVQINRLFAAYRDLIVFSPQLVPADPQSTQGEAVSCYMGEGTEDHNPYQYPTISDLVTSVAQRAKLPPEFKVVSYTAEHPIRMLSATRNVPQDGGFWHQFSYVAFALVNTDRADSYAKFGWPTERPFMRQIETMRLGLSVLGRMALGLAFGDGAFKPAVRVHMPYQDFGGRVLVAGVGTSMVPNYPLRGAMVGDKCAQSEYELPGWFWHTFYFTDPYGRYEMRRCATPFIRNYSAVGYNPEAVAWGADGLISHMKDEGPQGQSIYKSMGLAAGGQDVSRVNIVTFRAAPVTILDLVNPQTMKAYSSVEFISRDSLAELSKRNVYGFQKEILPDGIITTFVEPDKFFFLKLKAGAPGNEYAQVTRAFILGVADRSFAGSDREIDGPGLLAADHPILLGIPQWLARSMSYLNDKRLAVLERNRMADERIVEFQDQSRKLEAASEDPGIPAHRAAILAREAVTYNTLNHPVLRGLINEAVAGVVWYLGLMVPLVFFLERLLFGFADIRRQLAAQAAIFAVTFSLLWLLHPALGMIRSSIMILLGFVIMLISGGITILFCGKFQENLKALKMRRGRVTAAEVNVLGVAGTAFMLGLSNMHRRKVRTGLTCATLVVITFAMVCFTSVRTDLVDKALAIGKAPYQGLLVKREKLFPISPVEEFGLQTAFGDDFPVASRFMLVGEETWQRELFNPQISIVYEPATAGAGQPAPVAREVAADSLLQLSADEPLRSQIRMLTRRPWFDASAGKDPGSPIPVFLPDTMAANLGISPQAADGGGAMVKINGKQFAVGGIFSAESLDRACDLDGQTLLPFDVKAMHSVLKTRLAGQILVSPDDPRVSASRLIIAPQVDLGMKLEHSQRRLASVAIDMGALGYKAARQRIDRFLEQSGQPTYYGLDGVAYRGQRTRQSSLASGLSLLVPLLIAALTVLATMKGSVYERRDEIFVYNALGIAPWHVFFMFLAEGAVYAVVGSVLGYIFSQGMGRALMAAGWTGGLNMTFTSLWTVYVSLAIALTVMLSTLLPAWTAMKISMPAEDAGWTLPPPEDDALKFQLPFTFGQRDRVAILAFFHRYFLDHGEGGGGPFHCGATALAVDPRPDPLDGLPVPQISTQVWLKPFDRGVSQRLVIALPKDPETGEYVARIRLERLSGTLESWVRLNERFVSKIRRHFLHWRAVGPDQRAAMFGEARALLESGRPGEIAHG